MLKYSDFGGEKCEIRKNLKIIKEFFGKLKEFFWSELKSKKNKIKNRGKRGLKKKEKGKDGKGGKKERSEK